MAVACLRIERGTKGEGYGRESQREISKLRIKVGKEVKWENRSKYGIGKASGRKDRNFEDE